MDAPLDGDRVEWVPPKDGNPGCFYREGTGITLFEAQQAARLGVRGAAEALKQAGQPMGLARNPYLPERPEDGVHVYKGPVDIGGNSRCLACGAYAGSQEGEAPCEGEYRESATMRHWVEQMWAVSRARAAGQPRRIALICTEQVAPRRVGGALFTSRSERFVLLECGHRVPCQLNTFEDGSIEWFDDETRIFKACSAGDIEVFGCPDCAKRFAYSGAGSKGNMRTSAQIELEGRPDLADPEAE